MNAENFVTITSRGMITIPLGLRKKYNLKPGTQAALVEDEGKLILIPLVDIEESRKKFPSRAEMLKIIEKADHQEMELER